MECKNRLGNILWSGGIFSGTGKTSKVGFLPFRFFIALHPTLRMPYLVLNDAIITMMSTYLGLRRNITLQ